ncbi:MAG: MBL fold metallo-hydrolase [Pseudolabrys sp.]|nr:MBL fold metallo-hydrolase [Pseudolabrys sp.]
MLFGPCAEGPVAPFLSSVASTLCAGGAGFVSAVIATLAAGAKTAPAKTLGKAVPQVDRLAVRMVTDNIVIQFLLNEQRDGLTIERKSGNTSPDKPPRAILNGEWGLAMHAQSHRGTEERNVMIDFGYTPEVLLNNMDILKIDASLYDAIVLSHGHYDHFGGMVGFLKATKGKLKSKIPFYVGGEDCFCIRRNPGGNFGALDRKAILDADLMLMMASEPAVVADHAFTTGRIGQTSFETPLRATDEIVGIFDGFGCFPEKMPTAKNTGGYMPDDFEHELATIYMVKGKGLVVLTSCSHRGVINTVRQAMAASGVDKVHAVIGGFHVVPPLGDDYINKTIEEFRGIDPDYLITGHCTGDRFYDLARVALGDKVIHSAVGMRFVFGAG